MFFGLHSFIHRLRLLCQRRRPLVALRVRVQHQKLWHGLIWNMHCVACKKCNNAKLVGVGKHSHFIVFFVPEKVYELIFEHLFLERYTTSHALAREAVLNSAVLARQASSEAPSRSAMSKNSNGNKLQTKESAAQSSNAPALNVSTKSNNSSSYGSTTASEIVAVEPLSIKPSDHALLRTMRYKEFNLCIFY